MPKITKKEQGIQDPYYKLSVKQTSLDSLKNSYNDKLLLKKKSKKEKDNFIDEFKERKDKKVIIAKRFFGWSIMLFSFIFLINFISFLNNYHKALNFQSFIENFLGHNIYFVICEIFILFLAFYFLSLYKSYLKIVELYDSNILLIKSDFFYKDDNHFQCVDHKDKLFNMRQQNIQKIHSLPDKIFDILNGKDSIKESPNAINAVNNLLEIIKNVSRSK